jgi:serine/threonine protein kinase
MQTAIPVPDFGLAISFSDFYGSPASPLLTHADSITTADRAAISESRGLVFDYGCPIRCTTNSTVYKASSIADGSAWAVKVAPIKSHLKDEFSRCANIPASPFLTQVVDFFETRTTAFLQMELCHEGDIVHKQFTEPQAWRLINNISAGLAEIHHAGWIHLDVSPGNILQSRGLFKLADFGTLTQMGKFREGDEGAGPYVSPEALEFPNGPHVVDGQTDIFSLGVVMLEAITGRVAPRGGSARYGEIRAGRIGLGSAGYACDVSVEMQQIVNRMLSVSPGDRPTAVQLLEVTCGDI